METLGTVTQIINNSSIPNAFGIDANSFLILISGSFIVGYICLTLYYLVYNADSNYMWKQLNFSEKAVVSLVIGFLTIFVSILIVELYKLSTNFEKKLEQSFLQLNYLFPFILFVIFSWLINLKKKYQNMEFIKKYIMITVIWIFLLSVILISIVFYMIQNWLGILILFIPIIVLLFVSKKREMW